MSKASNLAGFAASISSNNNLNVGIITASSFVGNLTGNSTGMSGAPNLNVGVVTASSFFGDGAGLTGVGIGTTGNVNTTGIITASSFVGNLTGTATGLSGSPNVVLGIATVSAGSTSAPSITPTGDSNTGIFFPSADTIAFTEGGIEALRINSSSNIGVGTTNPSSKLEVYGGNTTSVTLKADTEPGIDLNTTDGNKNVRIFNSYGNFGISGYSGGENYILYHNNGSGVPANQYTYFQVGGSERLRITGSGRLLVGTSSARNWSGITPQFQSEGLDVNSASASFTANINSANGSFLSFIKSRGTTLNSNTLVSSGDILGALYFNGADGTSPVQAAVISAQVDGTPGSNDMPGRLVFSTTADGASGPTERLRISSNGALSAAMGNGTDTANALLTLNRVYNVHPGKQTDLYGLYASIGSGGGNTDNCAAVFGLANIELAPGVTGKSGATYTTGIGVMGWCVGNTDGYGTSVGLYARLQQTGATNGGLVGLLIDLPNYSGGSSGVTYRSAYTGSATQTVLSVQRNNSTIGSITTTQTATAYNTSSDYRLKENIVPLTSAIPRLLQIPVHRFNFINAPETTVDGFIAHEVASYVPEAVTGKKDEMREVAVLDADEKPIFDENNNPITKLEPVYQGIDQSKLVPLLTAALQEAVSEINALKERVAALESQ